MKIVVTGALGHIGSKFIREIPLCFPEAEIIMIDNLSAQRYCSLFNLPVEGNYHFIEADVLNMDLKVDLEYGFPSTSMMVKCRDGLPIDFIAGVYPLSGLDREALKPYFK